VRSASVEEARDAYDGFCRGLSTLSAKGDLDVRDARTGRTQRLGVRVLAQSGGRLYLKGSVAIVTAIEAVSDGERFWLQVPSRKTVWTGPATRSIDSEREDAPYYALRPADVAAALLPEPLQPRDGEALFLEGDRATVSLTLASLEPPRVVRRRVWLAREDLQPLRASAFDARGDLVSDVRFGEWRDGFPRRITIARPMDGYVAALSLDSVRLNEPVPGRAFAPRLPEGYKVVEVS
jgi:outer membrane lipoprotein-sorting protein